MRQEKVRVVVSVPFSAALFEQVAIAAEREGKKIPQFIREAALERATGITVRVLDGNFTFINRTTAR